MQKDEVTVSNAKLDCCLELFQVCHADVVLASTEVVDRTTTAEVLLSLIVM